MITVRFIKQSMSKLYAIFVSFAFCAVFGYSVFSPVEALAAPTYGPVTSPTRTVGTTYQNTSASSSILVYGALFCVDDNDVVVAMGTTTAPTNVVATCPGYTWAGNFTVEIPPQWYYRSYRTVGTSGSITLWKEQTIDYGASGSSTTTNSTTTNNFIVATSSQVLGVSIINQDLFNLIVLFFALMWFVIWWFKKR